MVEEKAYDLEGSKNFRDLGGYPTYYGTRVKYGMIIRGARLADLTMHDRQVFNSLGIKTVFDLRSRNEADEFPNYQVPGAVNVRYCALKGPGGEEIDFSPANLERNFGSLSPAKFGELYKKFPFNNEAYHKLFEYLEEKKAPLFFHCSSGKDRTGIAAIIILLALGVSREDALYDYSLTNKYNAPLLEALYKERGIKEDDTESREKLKPMYGVEPAMAAGAIDAIYQKYQTIDNYMMSEYGFDKEKLSRLRSIYTE